MMILWFIVGDHFLFCSIRCSGKRIVQTVWVKVSVSGICSSMLSWERAVKQLLIREVTCSRCRSQCAVSLCLPF